MTWKITFHNPLEQGNFLEYEVVLHTDTQGQMYPQLEVLGTKEPIPGYGDPSILLEATPIGDEYLTKNKAD